MLADPRRPPLHAAPGAARRLLVAIAWLAVACSPGAPPSPPQAAAPPAPTGPPAAEPAASTASRPDVIIYVVDTLRADRLGCYGYGRPISPAIDAFAARATLFTHAIAQSSWTKPAVASMLTGRLPPAHGATGWKHRLPAQTDTLAELLGAAGYRTEALVTNPHVVAKYGFDQGFERFELHFKVPSSRVNELVFPWLEEPRDGRPLLLYVHTIDPHAPYAPPEPYRHRFAAIADQMPTWKPRWRWPLDALPHLSALYDADIAFADAGFGRFVARLEELGLYDDSLIVFVSDHGEEFKEHGHWRHGNTLHAETVDVPLIVKFPGQRRGRRVEEPVQQVDLLPTILDLVGRPLPAGAVGRSLAAERLGPPGPIFSHLHLGDGPLVESVVAGDFKLIATGPPGEAVLELYDWRRDPGERVDLAARLPQRTAGLAALLAERRRLAAAETAAEEVAMDAETEAALKALGYLQ